MGREGFGGGGGEGGRGGERVGGRGRGGGGEREVVFLAGFEGVDKGAGGRGVSRSYRCLIISTIPTK